MTHKYIPPFVIEVVETDQTHNNKWPDYSLELQRDLREIYHIDIDLLIQALNLHSSTVRHFNVRLDKERTPPRS
jgi:hypothetical protein